MHIATTVPTDDPYGSPPVFVGAFGPRMIEVAGEVADGLIVHPFNTRRSLEELVLPALARGRVQADRDDHAVKLVWVSMVVTWTTDEEHAIAIRSAQEQLAFYGSTSAYASVPDIEGYDGLHADLNAMSKQGRWTEMATIIPGELLADIVGHLRRLGARPGDQPDR